MARVPLLSALLALLALLAAPAAAQSVVSYEQVAPLLEAKCTVCHDSEDQGGGLDLSSFDAILRGGASGDVVVPGDARGSKLYRVVARLEQPFMPRGDGPLNAKELKLLERWIETGMRQTPKGPPLEIKKKAGVELKLPTSTGPAPLPQALVLDALPARRRADAAIALDVSPGAPLAALGARDQVLCYELPQEPQEKLRASGFLGSLRFPGRVHRVSFSRSGAHLLAFGGEAAQEGRALLFDVRSGRTLLDVKAGKDVFLAGDLREDSGQLALGGPDRRVRLVSCQGEPERLLAGHTDWVTALAYSPDGVLLASADRAGGVFLWESRSAQQYLRLPAHPARISVLAWRPDSNLLVTGCEDGWIRAFEVYEGKEVAKLNAHPGGVLDASFAKDGKLVSSGRDRLLKIWSVKGELLAQSRRLPDLPLRVRFHPSGEGVVGGDWLGNLRTWRLAKREKPAKGKPPFRLPERSVVPATPPSLERHLTQAKQNAARARLALVRTRLALDRLRAAELTLRRDLQLLGGAQRATIAHAQPHALLAQEALVRDLERTLEAARRASPQGTTQAGGEGAVRAGAAKGQDADAVPIIEQLLSSARAEARARARTWVGEARGLLALARRQRAQIAQGRAALAQRRQRRAELRAQLAQVERAPAFAALAFWEAERTYREAWRARARAEERAQAAEAAADAARAELAHLQAHFSSVQERARQLLSARAQAAQILLAARVMSREAASLSDDLRRSARGLLRVGALRKAPADKTLAQARELLTLARESLSGAHEARRQGIAARQTLRRVSAHAPGLALARSWRSTLLRVRAQTGTLRTARDATALREAANVTLARLAPERERARAGVRAWARQAAKKREREAAKKRKAAEAAKKNQAAAPKRK